MNLENMPILNGLLKHMNKNITPFHMPGHKNNINNFDELELISENLYGIDKTEIPGLDNLHIPKEMILHAEILASRAFKSSKSYFLVNGSTCGISSMIMGVTKPKDKVIVQRNCHQSVFMACLMGDLSLCYINPDVLSEFNIAGAVSVKEIVAIMDANRDAKAIVLTYPTYYGTCSDLLKITLEAHKRNMLVLVDEAHGAHLPFNVKLPISAMDCGADVSVISLHKSLPALTQASLLNIGGGIISIRAISPGIEFMLKIFQSSSPSYVLMASIDAARNIMESRGNALLDKLIYNIDVLSNKLSNLGGYKILGKEQIGIASIKDVDITKIVIASKSSLSGRDLEMKLLNEHNIQIEMSDINNIVLIGSVGDSDDAFEKLFNALYNINKEGYKSKTENILLGPIKYQTCTSMRDAYYSEKKTVPLIESRGLISGEAVVPYPPGIPVLLPGELITQEIIDYIELVKAHGIMLSSINDSSGENILVI